MKTIFATFALVFTVAAASTTGHAGDKLEGVQGPYLGQTPPGLTAMPFAPGIVNTEEWGDVGGFSPDMNEFYVSRWRHTRDAPEPENAVYKREGDGWQRLAGSAETRRPFFAPDGNTLHFKAEYKERTTDGWSKMKSLGPAFEDIPIMGLSASAKGTLVFDEFTRDGNGTLRYSKLVDGKREAPRALPKEINTGMWNAHPFIAPDESYILWDGQRASGFGEGDLYISFRQPDGSWGEGINLGDKVNTDAQEGGPQVTPDGKYLFFNRMVPLANGDTGSQSDLYWIDAQVIENLRPKP